VSVKHVDQRRVRRAAVLTAVIALAVTAYGGGTAGARTADSDTACDLPLGDDNPDDADGALVVMLDGTVSSANEADRVDNLVGLVDAATADASLTLSLGSFGGSDDEVRYSGCLDGDLFVPDGNNARTRARNRPALIEGLTEELTALPGGYEASDPTSALRAGIRRLDGVEGTRVLVIHTDGIATAGCAALPDEVNLSEPGLAEQLTDACVNSGQLPTADGIEIVIGGIGRTTQDLTAESVTFLLEFNTALCEATGALCRVDPNLPSHV